ncbi:hypothetical protein [Butyrivibrio sp. AE2032]|uniref:hypothetical protein n=1 Tax=Butyrivibrio sp. AE2032 TaxID=1458463 RepID=UPI000551FDCF|nr:hypothetical protein [Butyrivibrio sp. AE2032]
MKCLFDRSFSKLLCLALFCLVLFSPIFSIKAEADGKVYVSGVEISEDTYNTLFNATKVYNGVDYGKLDGYNPLYYFMNYSDLREAYGANPEKLVEHWALYGRSANERRVSSKLVVRNAQTGSSSYEYVVPSNQKTSKQSEVLNVIPGELHSNGGMSRVQEDLARSIAKQIADHVYTQVTTKGKGTQIEMVAYATGMVSAYCSVGRHLTNDEAKKAKNKDYRTAYGVFISREYTSAGSTRALGLVLDYLDGLCQENNAKVYKQQEEDKAAGKTSNTNNNATIYPPLKWVHVNANKWDDQWCQVVCDNHEAYADANPTYASAGYGKHPNQGGSKKDITSYIKFATEADIFTTRPQLVDGGSPVYMNHQINNGSN